MRIIVQKYTHPKCPEPEYVDLEYNSVYFKAGNDQWYQLTMEYDYTMGILLVPVDIDESKIVEDPRIQEIFVQERLNKK